MDKKEQSRFDRNMAFQIREKYLPEIDAQLKVATDTEIRNKC